MPRFQVKHKGQKVTKQADCQNFDQLLKLIEVNFNIQAKNIIFIKPRIKSQEDFKKSVKQNDQITINGKVQTEKSKEQVQKLQKIMNKIEQIKEKKQNQKRQKQKLICKDNQKILRIRQQRQKGIKHKGIQYFDYKQNIFIDLGIEYALCPIHLLLRIPQFVNYCKKQQNISQKIEGLLIQELKIMFFNLSQNTQKFSYVEKMENNNSSFQYSQIKQSQLTQNKYIQQISHQTISNYQQQVQSQQQCQQSKFSKNLFQFQEFVCPLQWISSWLQYCCDFVQFPYPTLDLDYFLMRTFKTIKKNEQNVLQAKQIYYYHQKYVIQQIFGIVVKINQEDLAQYQQYLNQNQKQKQNQNIKYLLQCDLSKKQLGNIFLGIKERFKKKLINKSMHYQDREITQTIISIQYLPQYVFIHLNRFQYIPQQEKGKKIKLSQKKKSFHQVKYDKYIDFTQLCSESLAQKLKNQNIVYQLIGVIFHKGDFYHERNYQHKHSCRGDFQTMVYDSGDKWLKFHRAQVQQITLNDVINEKYWGKQNQWTPILLLYKQQKKEM